MTEKLREYQAQKYHEEIRNFLQDPENYNPILPAPKLKTEPINILVDGPPGPDGGRFVEVETDAGKSVNAGEWIEREDGLWALRITSLPVRIA